MDIPSLLSTKERVKILNNILYPLQLLSVNRTAQELGISKGLVSKFFHTLYKEKILKKTKNKFIVLDNLLTRSLKILLNLNSFDAFLFKKYPFLKSVGLYGSLARGENTRDSDIDLWLLIEKTKEEYLAGLTKELKKKYPKIKPLYLTEEKLKILKKEDVVFYYSLFFGSITLYGDGIEKI